VRGQLVLGAQEARGGGRMGTATEANSRMRLVIAAMPAIRAKGSEVVVPVLARAAEAAQLHDRKGKVEQVIPRPLGDASVEGKARLVTGPRWWRSANRCRR
jgi:hypothetical protein